MRRPAAAAALSDEQLMRSVQADDDRAFELLYDRHQHRAWQVAGLLCRPRDCVERIVQDAFIAAWRGRVQYQPGRETVRAWTMRLVYQSAEDGPASGTSSSHRGGETPAIERTELRGLLDRLPEPQKEIIALAVYGGLTHVQIAALLSLPTDTVKGRMRLGLHKLRGVTDVHQADHRPG